MALTPFFFGRDQSIYDPLDRILEPFDRFPLWDNAPSRQFAQDVSAIASTRVDWLETPDAHIFKADLPGLKKEEIKVQVEDGRTLQISGERKKEGNARKRRWRRRTNGIGWSVGRAVSCDAFAYQRMRKWRK
ncbi:hypothetical protein O6H91_10G097200 [Diphasiastrum complanatum]|uniref:Uncharacterized protein n=1 Tax=Diphasiastrum complanatum TaxID=34168 RepID=A0ACC2CJW6_DIPCM|nr:hypothetical protein O6H91_10G097200 [Diphasiastrum complanatum]